MFFCSKSQNRNRGVAIIGILISISYITLRLLFYTEKLTPYPFMSENLYKNTLDSDLLTFSFLFLGSLLLFLRTIHGPPHMVTAVDIYNDMSETRQSNLRDFAGELSNDVDIMDFSSEFAKDCGEANYNEAVNRTGVDHIAAPSARLARLFLILAIGSYSSTIVSILRPIIEIKAYNFKIREFNVYLGILAFIMIYFISITIVLYVSDPSKIPHSPPRSIDPEITNYVAHDALSFLADVPGLPVSHSNLGSTNRQGVMGQNQHYGYSSIDSLEKQPSRHKNQRNNLRY